MNKCLSCNEEFEYTTKRGICKKCYNRIYRYENGLDKYPVIFKSTKIKNIYTEDTSGLKRCPSYFKCLSCNKDSVPITIRGICKKCYNRIYKYKNGFDKYPVIFKFTKLRSTEIVDYLELKQCPDSFKCLSCNEDSVPITTRGICKKCYNRIYRYDIIGRHEEGISKYPVIFRMKRINCNCSNSINLIKKCENGRLVELKKCENGRCLRTADNGCRGFCSKCYDELVELKKNYLNRRDY